MTEREETNSIAIAYDEAFTGWFRPFTDPRLCAATVDRLTFNATLIETGTESYRLARTKAQHSSTKSTAGPRMAQPSTPWSCFTSRMSTTLGAPRPDPAAYMLRAAASAAGRDYKQEILELLDVQPGQTALDVGCGPGTDLPALAERVGASGTVIGVDRDLAMLAEARRRTNDLPTVQIREADAHALPVEPGTVDRAKIDRVLMHVAEPTSVLAQLHLATRPGARIALAEPDWDTLVVDAQDLDTSRAFTRYTTSEVVRHATIGRSLARHAQQTGFVVETVNATTPVFLDFRDADHTLGLGRNMQRAIQDGHINEARGRRWFTSLSEAPFYASFTLVTVICSR